MYVKDHGDRTSEQDEKGGTGRAAAKALVYSNDRGLLFGRTPSLIHFTSSISFVLLFCFSSIISFFSVYPIHLSRLLFMYNLYLFLLLFLSWIIFARVLARHHNYRDLVLNNICFFWFLFFFFLFFFDINIIKIMIEQIIWIQIIIRI